jgi:hypothetical protein
MSFILSLFSTGTIKYIVVLLIIVGLGHFVYSKHRQIVELEKQVALQQYNITQLEQNVKDNNEFIRKLEELNNYKGKIVAELYKERDSLEEKMRGLEEEINKNVIAGHDRQSSKVLKDLFKALGSN